MADTWAVTDYPITTPKLVSRPRPTLGFGGDYDIADQGDGAGLSFNGITETFGSLFGTVSDYPLWGGGGTSGGTSPATGYPETSTVNVDGDGGFSLSGIGAIAGSIFDMFGYSEPTAQPQPVAYSSGGQEVFGMPLSTVVFVVAGLGAAYLVVKG